MNASPTSKVRNHHLFTLESLTFLSQRMQGGDKMILQKKGAWNMIEQPSLSSMIDAQEQKKTKKKQVLI